MRFYYINNNGAATLRVISASNFSAERWAQTALIPGG